jgi:hypothetical protein
VGPIALFDKSFLQSLSVDESVWFDHHFLPVVCPVFYTETLADLAKEPSARGPAEKLVRVIASKFPECGGSPCANHVDLCISDLMGDHIPLDGRVPRSGGRIVKGGDRAGVVYDDSPEAQAFMRWQNGDFEILERQFARIWRQGLTTLDLGEIAKGFRAIGIDGKRYKTFEEIKAVADSVVTGRDKPFDRMKLAVSFFNVPQHLHAPLLERWSFANRPPLSTYAPYAAFVMTVEIFFQLALAANLISADRPSNRMDIAYLFYLPFCMLFVSGDKLHQKSAPLFLRVDQEFVWGPDLKADLQRLNQQFKTPPEDVRDQGIMNFAGHPPATGDFLVTRLWDGHMRPNWRERKAKVTVDDPSVNKKIVDDLLAFTRAPSVPLEQMPLAEEAMNMMSIERKVSKRKGSWWQLPKDLQIPDDEISGDK